MNTVLHSELNTSPIPSLHQGYGWQASSRRGARNYIPSSTRGCDSTFPLYQEGGRGCVQTPPPTPAYTKVTADKPSQGGVFVSSVPPLERGIGGVFLLLATLFFFFAPLPSLAQGEVSGGLEQAANQVFTGASKEKDLSLALGKILRVILEFVGVLFFVLLTAGGILWMSASGNTNQIEKAKALVMGSIIGLIITLSSYIITTTVIKALGSAAISEQSEESYE